MTDKIPYLEDWVTPGEAANMLGLTKQAVHNLMANGSFKTLHQVGTAGERPFYLLRASEVKQLAAEREEVKEAKEHPDPEVKDEKKSLWNLLRDKT